MKTLRKICKGSESKFKVVGSMLKSTENMSDNYTQSQLNRIDDNKSIKELEDELFENQLSFYGIFDDNDDYSKYIDKKDNSEYDIAKNNGDSGFIPFYIFDKDEFKYIDNDELDPYYKEIIVESKQEFENDNVEWNRMNFTKYILTTGDPSFYII